MDDYVRFSPSCRLRTGFTFLLFFLLVSNVTVLDAAYGNLLVAPTRVVFEGRTKVQEVSVINQGDKEALFRIFFTQLQMDGEGKYHVLPEGVDNKESASQLIRYSPRQIRIKPGERQLIRLLLRKPPHLEEGEYRSHLEFKAIPDEADLVNAADEEGDGERVGVILTPIFGVSIPVLVRHGQVKSTYSLKDLQLFEEEGKSKLSMKIERQGLNSYFGNIKVYFQEKGVKSKTLVKRAEGVAVLHPLSERKITLDLDSSEERSSNEGTYHIIYENAEEHSQQLLAEGFFMYKP